MAKDKFPELKLVRNIGVIAHIAQEAPEGVRAYGTLRDAIFAARGLVSIADRAGPPIASAGMRGGTSIFKDHSACPFRAFAKHRLRSRPLETPRPGLDRSGDRRQ